MIGARAAQYRASTNDSEWLSPDMFTCLLLQNKLRNVMIEAIFTSTVCYKLQRFAEGISLNHVIICRGSRLCWILSSPMINSW